MRSEITEKIKLFVIVKSIDGGTGTFLINFLKIKNLFPSNKFALKTIVLEEPTYRNVRDYNFEYFRGKNFYPQKYSFSPLNFINFFMELFWLKDKFDDFEPTLVMGADLRCNLLAIFLKILSYKKTKIIATNHIDLGKTISDKSTLPVALLLKKTISYLYNKADLFVCCSQELSRSSQSDFNLKKDVITVYNGMKFEKYLPRSANSNNKKKKIIITIARLVEQKDHINLIKAFELLQKKYKNVDLWITSDGPLRKQLESYVNDHKFNNKIKFLGWVKDINSYLRKADIFVFSSKREGFAYVLVEAMAQGLPVVSTDTPYGPREVLENGKYGVLVPVNDPVSLEKEMFKLLTDKNKYNYFAKKSLERTRYFSVEKMIKNYKRIILNLL